jgi:hypothetical protein
MENNEKLSQIEFSGIITGAAIRIIQEKFPEEFEKYYSEGKEAYLKFRDSQK